MWGCTFTADLAAFMDRRVVQGSGETLLVCLTNSPACVGAGRGCPKPCCSVSRRRNSPQGGGQRELLQLQPVQMGRLAEHSPATTSCWVGVLHLGAAALKPPSQCRAGCWSVPAASRGDISQSKPPARPHGQQHTISFEML